MHKAREVWAEVDTELRAFVKKEAESLTDNLDAVLVEAGRAALKEERERFKHRLAEVQRAIAETSIFSITS